MQNPVNKGLRGAINANRGMRILRVETFQRHCFHCALIEHNCMQMKQLGKHLKMLEIRKIGTAHLLTSPKDGRLPGYERAYVPVAWETGTHLTFVN